ncbi:MAG: amidase domain-containing protein [Eubacteriaceae bacterium]|nr:amidase domain-containing protein [Eubacteriaceae bacterium]
MHKQKKIAAAFLAVALCVCIASPASASSRAQMTDSRRKAASYAVKYALTTNDHYHRYSDANCANYVSQCLYASGRLKPDDTWYLRSGAWDGATSMYRWLIRSGNGELIKRYDSEPSAKNGLLQVGDLVFYDWKSTGSMHHVAIVTDIVDGVPKICANTTDRKNLTWSYTPVMADSTKRNATWYLVRIKY